MRSILMRAVFAFAVALIFAGQSLAAEAQPSDPGGFESLGRELVDDLTPDVLRRPATPPHDPAAPAPRFDDLGEDIGRPTGPLSLVRVRQSMQQAEELLAQQKAADGTDTLRQAADVQRQVVDELDKLIAELSKQCRGGECQAGDQPPQPSQASQAKADQTGAEAVRGPTAARDSTTRLGQAASRPAEKRDIETLVNELWGHLPPRSREQMRQSFSDEFLPKYELEIEQYYSRLSEEQQSRHE
jgi:hypothetical protein